MPIYSRSRSTGVVANESYTEHDMGRIMYECAVNDQKVFNAVMVREFQEMDARKGGTMLESELASFQEFSVKEAWNSLKEKLKKLWEKIKGVFRAVFAKITVFLVRDGKTLVKMHKKNILGKNCDKCKMPKLRLRKGDKFDWSMKPEKVDMTFEKVVEQNKSSRDTDYDVSDLTETLLAAEGLNAKSCSEVYDEVMDKTFEDEETGKEYSEIKSKYDTSYLFNTLENGHKCIKSLKEAQKKTDKLFKNLINKLDKKATSTDDSKVKDGEANSKVYSNCSKYVSAFQSVINTMTGATISVNKFEIKQCRKIFGALAAYTPGAKNESADLAVQCAIVEAAEEFDQAMDASPDEINAPDVQDAIAADPEIQIIINTDGEG